MPQTPKQPEKPKKTNQRNKPARKPLGDGIELSDEDLDKLAEISEVDLKTADALWKTAAPKPVKKLLESDVKEES